MQPSAAVHRGIARGDTVAVMLANTPAMLEAHYGVPMTGAVLNTLNTRLDAAIIAFTLDHGEAKVLITDREFSKTIKEALALGIGLKEISQTTARTAIYMALDCESGNLHRAAKRLG